MQPRWIFVAFRRSAWSMSEGSRLGREAIETAYAMKQLVRPASASSSSLKTASRHSTPPPTTSCSR